MTKERIAPMEPVCQMYPRVDEYTNQTELVFPCRLVRLNLDDSVLRTAKEGKKAKYYVATIEYVNQKSQVKRGRALIYEKTVDKYEDILEEAEGTEMLLTGSAHKDLDTKTWYLQLSPFEFGGLAGDEDFIPEDFEGDADAFVTQSMVDAPQAEKEAPTA